MSSNTVDLVAAIGFGVSTLVFGGLFLWASFTGMANKGKPNRACRIVRNAAKSSLILSVVYISMFFNAGLFTRPADGVVVPLLHVLAWPLLWWFLGQSIGAHLFHSAYWTDQAAWDLALAALFHVFGAVVPNIFQALQILVLIAAFLAALGAVIIAFVYRQDDCRDGWVGLTSIVLAALGVVVGFQLLFGLSEFLGNVLGPLGTQIWLLVANVVVFIGYYAFLLLTWDNGERRED